MYILIFSLVNVFVGTVTVPLFHTPKIMKALFVVLSLVERSQKKKKVILSSPTKGKDVMIGMKKKTIRDTTFLVLVSSLDFSTPK